MINLKGKFGVDTDTITKIVEDEIHHPDYHDTVRRAKVMNSWYKAVDDTQQITTDRILGNLGEGESAKSDIIQRSHRESLDDYEEKLGRMKLFPFERKFYSAQQRIYDENNVQRTFPEGSQEFWEWKLNNFDDNGDSAGVYYKDKVLFVKDVLGFGASVVDIMMADNGNRVMDSENKLVPYSYVVRPHELFNYQIKQGVLTFMVTVQRERTFDPNKEKHVWRAFTKDRIHIWEQIDREEKQGPRSIPNAFGQVPANILRGDIDQDSGFRVGKPLRYALTGLYLAASELFYDLQQGSFLFGHPIPFMPLSIVQQMAGAGDQDTDEIDRDEIRNTVGMVGIYPDNFDLPNELFFQADMSGLEFLKATIFQNLIPIIFQLASVRDKSEQPHNVSGRAKEFDNVDEQGLLAQTAREMEGVERNDFKLMSKVRGEEFDEFGINYTKHHDLSSASEIFADMTDAAQYGINDQALWEYWITEYLRKRSAPSETQTKAEEFIKQLGRPLTKKQFEAIGNELNALEKIVKMRPEILNQDSRSTLLNNIEDIRSQFEDVPTNGQE